MSLKFTCPTCGIELVIQFLKPGETARCNNCSADVVVPHDAEQVAWDSSLKRDKAKSLMTKENLIQANDDEELNNEVKKTYPTIFQAVLLFLSFILLTFLGIIIIDILESITKLNFQNNIFVEAISEILIACIVIFIGFKRSKSSFENVFPLKPFSKQIFFPSLVIIIGMEIILSEIDNLFSMVLPPPESFIQIFTDLLKNPFDTVLLAVILAPLIEETLCRGLVLHGFLKNYSEKKAVFISALLFGFAHLNPWQFIGAFAYGVIFAWLYIKTKSLWPCYISHAVANLIPLVAIHIPRFIIPGFTGERPVEPVLQPWWFDLIGLALTGLGIWWLMELFRKDSDNRIEDSNLSLL